ncbi:MAG TPA: sigma factor, partial [Gemmataceae bacterium]|nr:sigma factor [Gemmataceae bacterium]
MSLRTLPGALRHLFRGTDTPDLLGCTDRELLRRFAEERDESAFVALVCRHGPLVLGVCQRVLRRTADAEDAFQATFLALSRGAASTSWRESVAGWLHDVAWRTATKMKTGEARRRSHEARAGKPLSIVMPDASGDEVGAILDEELRRLPLRYREPLLLCYRQGRT